MAAAGAVLAGDGVSMPKDTATAAESIRALLIARGQLLHAMTVLANVITLLTNATHDPDDSRDVSSARRGDRKHNNEPDDSACDADHDGAP